MSEKSAKNGQFLSKVMKIKHYAAVITIKHVSTFVNKVENPYVTTIIFDLIDKCRYVFYGYDGSMGRFLKKIHNDFF